MNDKNKIIEIFAIFIVLGSLTCYLFGNNKNLECYIRQDDVVSSFELMYFEKLIHAVVNELETFFQ